MQITIPDDVYSHLYQYAMRIKQPVESVIVERLRTSLDDPLHLLPIDEQVELRALSRLSNDTLLTIVSETLPPTVQSRLESLMNQNSRGTIALEAFRELEGLVERADRLMVRKAEAMAILKRRGQAFPRSVVRRMDA